MVGYEPVALVAELAAAPKGLMGAALPSSGTRLTLVWNDGAPAAMYSVCPHKEAELHLGDIEDANTAVGRCVKCPKHRKKFNGGLNFSITTGESWVVPPTLVKYEPTWAVPIYGVHLAHGVVYVTPAPVKGAIPPPGSGCGGDDDAAPPAAAAGGAGATAAPAPAPAAPAPTSAPAAAAPAPAPAPVGDGTWLPARIVSSTPLTADSSLYTLQPADGAVPAPPRPGVDRWSWHVSLKLPAGAGAPDATSPADIYGPVSREYTPVSPLAHWTTSPAPAAAAAAAGTPAPSMQLVIKHYPDGTLTSRLRRLPTGSIIWVSHPETTLSTPALAPAASAAAAAGADSIFGPGSVLGLLAGGTGITPMLQLASWALTSGESGVPERVQLLTFNRTPADLLAGDIIRSMVAAAGGRLRVLHTFTRSGGDLVAADGPDVVPDATLGDALSYTTGRLTPAALAAFLPRAPALRRLVVCGPPPLLDAVQPALLAAHLADSDADAARLLVLLDA